MEFENHDLLEREQELGHISALLKEAAGGSGNLVVLEAPAGMGKTQLLTAARAMAQAHDMLILEARGLELERDLAHGVVRQLFEHTLRLPEDQRQGLLQGAAALACPVLESVESDLPTRRPGLPSQGEGSLFPALHGLYWLLVNLAEHSPLLVIVDDLHWADPPSLCFLLYLCGRLDGLPVLLAVAVRPAESESDLLARLVSWPRAEVLRLRALSEGAVASVVRASYGTEAEERFCRGCHAATRGNPYFLRELLRTLRDQGVQPTEASLPRLHDVAPVSISRDLVLRLQRLPSGARELARAVALLGERTPLRQAAALARLEEHQADEVADALSAVEILDASRPLRFVHPIARAAIYADLGPGGRARGHLRAARLLTDEAAPADRVASHLLHCEPMGDDWAVDTLRSAAAGALARGAVETAVAYLRRCLEEPPPVGRLSQILWELGAAEKRLDPAASLEHLQQALEGTEIPRERALICLELLQALLTVGRVQEAVNIVQSCIAAVEGTDTELALRLEAELITGLRQGLATSPLADQRLSRWRGRVQGESPAERLILAHLAVLSALTGSDAACVAELAERALGDGRLLADQTSDSILFYLPLYPLMCADRFQIVETCLDAALRDAQSRGSLQAFALASMFRSFLAYARGQISDAEAEARQATEAATQLPGWRYALPGALDALVSALIERGDLEGAEGALRANAFDQELADSVPSRLLLATRGRLRLAQGRTRDGLDDFLELMGREEQRGPGNLFLNPYRGFAALGACLLGDTDRALELVDQELRRARIWGSPRILGTVLYLAGLVHGGSDGLDLLREAVEVLEESPARLARGQALVEFGAALRRAGHDSDAVKPLRRGLDLAYRCGATTLAERTRAELFVLGARPRRPALSGIDALTPSERRVARMAAEGPSNRDIAQALFVTLGTIEVHLTHVYQKLNIRSRNQLPAILKAPAE